MMQRSSLQERMSSCVSVMHGCDIQSLAGGRLQVQWIPQLAGIQQLFSRAPTAASLWVHLLAINMFAARWIMFDGARLFNLPSAIAAA